MVLVMTPSAAPPGSKAVTIVNGAPEPPEKVLHALEDMQMFLEGDAEAKAALPPGRLPRPWEPATCPSLLREQVWLWCDDMAGWMNLHYAWHPKTLIPACWPWHPHIAAELPVLVCRHYFALEAKTPQAMEEWQRQTLPTFLDRLGGRLGEGACRVGKHSQWPSAPRYSEFTGRDARQERHELFHADTHQPTQLHTLRTV